MSRDEIRPPARSSAGPLPPLPPMPALSALGAAAAGAKGADPGKVLPFRRGGQRRGTRKRGRFLALTRYFLGALAVVGTPVGAALWVTTAAPFALADIEVHGTERLSPTAIESHLVTLLGQNLWRLDLLSIPRLLEDERWIATIEAKKEPPNRLRLEIVERKPAAILTDGPVGHERRSFVDPEGVAIATVAAAATDSGLIEIRMSRPGVPEPLVGLAVQRALAAVQELRRSQPEWAARLENLEILSEEDFVIHTAALEFPLQVSAGQVASRIANLVRLLPELEARYPAFESIDLRFSDRIVVRPKEKEKEPESETVTETAAEPGAETPADDPPSPSPTGPEAETELPLVLLS